LAKKEELNAIKDQNFEEIQIGQENESQSAEEEKNGENIEDSYPSKLNDNNIVEVNIVDENRSNFKRSEDFGYRDDSNASFEKAVNFANSLINPEKSVELDVTNLPKQDTNLDDNINDLSMTFSSFINKHQDGDLNSSIGSNLTHENTTLDKPSLRTNYVPSKPWLKRSKEFKQPQ